MSKQKQGQHGASGGVLKAACVVLGIVLLGMIAYGGLCTHVKNSGTILPNTYALGLNLGGMTEEEAEAQVEELLTDQYAQETLDIVVGEETVSVRAADLVQVDGSYAAQAAMEEKEALTFLQMGIRWFQSQGQDTTVGAGTAVTFHDLDSIFTQLETAIANAEMDPVETTYALENGQVTFTKGTPGQTVDQEGLKAAVLAALEVGDFTTPIPCPMTTIDPADFDLQAVYDAVYTPATDASCDKEGNIQADSQGFCFDLTAAQTALDNAAPGETVSVPLDYLEPTLTASELESLLFRDVLGTCTTNVGGTANRVSNVKLAASSCNNYILLPGETFSYNDTLGERTAERGYKEAGAYVSGETVEVLGGGICQVSSTIYLATLRADLEMTERHNHTYVSSYMPYGEDATVSWGGPDFKFTNNTDYPIKLVVVYSGGQLTATVYGTNLTGKYVEITNEVLSTTSYETVYEDTTELAAGQTKVKTTGYNGMKVKVYRNVYAADGTLISSTLESNNTYATRNKVIQRGVSG